MSNSLKVTNSRLGKYFCSLPPLCVDLFLLENSSDCAVMRGNRIFNHYRWLRLKLIYIFFKSLKIMAFCRKECWDNSVGVVDEIHQQETQAD